MSHRLRIRGKTSPRYKCPTGMVKDPDYPDSGTPCILPPSTRSHGGYSRYPINTVYGDKQPKVFSRLYGHEGGGHEYNFPARGLTRSEPAGYAALQLTRNRRKSKRFGSR